MSDEALLARVKLLVARERVASVELIAHLAVLETRDVYLGDGVRSLDRRRRPLCSRRHHDGRSSNL